MKNFKANFKTANGTYMAIDFENNSFAKIYKDVKDVAKGNSCGEEVYFWIIDVKKNVKKWFSISRDGKRAKSCGTEQLMEW